MSDLNPEDFMCPRCNGLIPSAEMWGRYPGALSRHTRSIDDQPLMVCSACGSEEAYEDMTGDLTPVDMYPILTEPAMMRSFDAIATIERHQASRPNPGRKGLSVVFPRDLGRMRRDPRRKEGR